MPDIFFLQKALGADASLVAVGGCVRDRLLGRDGGDLDLATSLMPEAVIERAKASGLTVIPTGLRHGTVTIVLNGVNIEITTYRDDGAYLDGRRPSQVNLGVSLEEDLARRDITINAMALPLKFINSNGWRANIIDPFGGQKDLEIKLIRTVGDPLQRFEEDGLRPYRVCRFVSQLGFCIEPKTAGAISQKLEVTTRVAVERVFVELSKLLVGQNAPSGLKALATHGLLDKCIPELTPTIGCEQNTYHAHDVWEHTLKVVHGSPADPSMRWAALLHDIGKPAVKFTDASGKIKFHGHEVASEKMAKQILNRLKASNAIQAEVIALIRHHGIKPDNAWSDAACRRLLHRLAKDGLDWRRWASLQLADQLGKGLDTEHIPQAHAEMVKRMERITSKFPPLNIQALAIDGRALMKLANKPQGPWIGTLQKHLFEVVIDDPTLNTAENLQLLAVEWIEKMNRN
ncbi:MAG: HD domain-containing protein [Holophagaceae bacterium]|nr:HD domain-containing protein [Holophagaceae bacterium]